MLGSDSSAPTPAPVDQPTASIATTHQLLEFDLSATLHRQWCQWERSATSATLTWMGASPSASTSSTSAGPAPGHATSAAAAAVPAATSTSSSACTDTAGIGCTPASVYASLKGQAAALTRTLHLRRRVQHLVDRQSPLLILGPGQMDTNHLQQLHRAASVAQAAAILTAQHPSGDRAPADQVLMATVMSAAAAAPSSPGATRGVGGGTITLLSFVQFLESTLADIIATAVRQTMAVDGDADSVATRVACKSVLESAAGLLRVHLLACAGADDPHGGDEHPAGTVFFTDGGSSSDRLIVCASFSSIWPSTYCI